jgi:DNA-binding response OmpR family regulator
VEDEALLAELISKKLKREGHNTKIIESVKDFKDKYKYPADLYILDIWLPDWTWFDIIRFLREIKNIHSPIIVSSWYWDTDKKIQWLNMWADDYIVKPYTPEELLARINALIRRTNGRSSNNLIYFRDFIYDPLNKKLNKWKSSVKLTKKEMMLFEIFVVNKWKLVKKSKLLSSVWWKWDENEINSNTLTVTISRLRKKLWKNFELFTSSWDWYILKP